MIQSRLLRRVGLLLALGAAYFIAGKLGLRLAFVNASATAVWPPTGIALVAFVLLGYDVWPAILASAFLVNLTTTGSVTTSIGIALGNTLEGVVGAYLVNRFARGRRAFDRPQDVFVFTALAAVVVLSGIAIWGTLHGFGPFVRATHNESLLLLQAFMGVTSVMTLALAALVAERNQVEDRLRQLAVSDPLTGLANYRQLTYAIDAEIKRFQRTERSFAVVLLDMEGLKKI